MDNSTTTSDKESETARQMYRCYSFPAHRNILAAVSDFFKAAFLTDMKEAREGKITLHDIDTEVFSLILTAVYCGRYVLTEENVFEIWAAANMLQIGVLTDQCEELFDEKLSADTCLDYLNSVRLLDEAARDRALDCISTHMEECGIDRAPEKITKEELMSLIANENLRVSSENFVLQVVLAWAERQSAESSPGGSLEEGSSPGGCGEETEAASSASQHLADLLDCTRYHLLNRTLAHGALARHPLVGREPRCVAVLEEMCEYWNCPHLHQTSCPPAAVHRDCSALANVLFVCRLMDRCEVPTLSLTDWSWGETTFPKLEHKVDNARVFFYDSCMFVFTGGKRVSKYVPEIKGWVNTLLNYGESHIRFLYDTLQLYKFDTINGELSITSVDNFSQIWTGENPRYSRRTFVEDCLKGMEMKHVTSLGSNHVVFFKKKGLDGYTVVSWDALQHVTKVTTNQLGSRSKLVSFGHEKDVFLLQEDGCLWRMQHGPE
ncbi:hypothetical protein EGW08_020281, partial [Elysia chlorotica]